MNSAQRLSLQESLALIASGGASDAVSLLSRSLPASVVSINGNILTVKFEVLSNYALPHIDVPVAGSEYVREPIQKGDRGLLIPCGASIEAISGMGGGVADLTVPANLSAYVFMPISNKAWKGVDGKMLVLTGLSDVMLRDDTHQLQLENEHSAWVSLIQQINALLLVIGPLLTTPQALTPIDAATNPVKVRQ